MVKHVMLSMTPPFYATLQYRKVKDQRPERQNVKPVESIHDEPTLGIFGTMMYNHRDKSAFRCDLKIARLTEKRDYKLAKNAATRAELIEERKTHCRQLLQTNPGPELDAAIRTRLKELEKMTVAQTAPPVQTTEVKTARTRSSQTAATATA